MMLRLQSPANCQEETHFFYIGLSDTHYSHASAAINEVCVACVRLFATFSRATLELTYTPTNPTLSSRYMSPAAFQTQ